MNNLKEIFDQNFKRFISQKVVGYQPIGRSGAAVTLDCIVEQKDGQHARALITRDQCIDKEGFIAVINEHIVLYQRIREDESASN